MMAMLRPPKRLPGKGPCPDTLNGCRAIRDFPADDEQATTHPVSAVAEK